MSLASWLGFKAAPSTILHTIEVANPNAMVSVDWFNIEGQSPAKLYRSQPHLRTVVDFLARNIAQLGLKSYQRNSANDRPPVTSGPIADLLRKPNPSMTRYELIRALVSDFALWDRAYWSVSPTIEGGWQIQAIPAAWVTGMYGGNLFQPGGFIITAPGKAPIRISAEGVIHFHGWSPDSTLRGVSPVETLKEILAEQIHSVQYRDQRWRNGGRVGQWLSRPAGAPDWPKEARARFQTVWKERYAGDDATDGGGTPLLEDGMRLESSAATSKDDEYVNASKLSLATVASAYHINPTMIGLLDNANYSNVREFRRMLYGDTLGPIIAMIEDRVNAFLLPMIGEDPDVYVEFNIAEKLQGSFEEQAAVMSASVGGPWMTRNEARAKNNLPKIEGADELIVPLNVVEGGQASPQDSVPKMAVVVRRKDGTVKMKATASEEHEKRATEVLKAFYARQKAVVLSRMPAKAATPAWWDQARWDKELAADLYELAVAVTQELAADTLKALGLPDEYDVDRTLAFLKAVAEFRAESINAVTLAQLQGLDDDQPPASVFEKAESSRAEQGGITLATTLAAFAAIESVKQVAPKSMKTWVVNSANPRPSHARMNGQSVTVGSLFSNGAKFPGDSVLGVDGCAGCTCTVELEATS